MDTLFVADAANYAPVWPRKVRHAVRGIIWRGGQLALVRSRRYGEYKFPGGGVQPGETQVEALAREIREETGLQLLPGSARPFGQVLEFRRDGEAEAIFEQHSAYYTCRVADEVGPTNQDNSEREYWYHLTYATPGQAAQNNRALADVGTVPAWSRREQRVLELLDQTIAR